MQIELAAFICKYSLFSTISGPDNPLCTEDTKVKNELKKYSCWPMKLAQGLSIENCTLPTYFQQWKECSRWFYGHIR